MSRLLGGFESGVARARAAGWDVRHGAVVAGGWPDSASLRIADVSVGLAGPGWAPLESLRWSGEELSISVSLVRPDNVTIVPVRPRSLRINDGPAIAIAADRMEIGLTLNRQARIASVHVEAAGFNAAIPGLGLLSSGNVDVAMDIDPSADRDRPGIVFSLSAHPVFLPGNVGWGLGSEIRDLLCEGAMNGVLPAGSSLEKRAAAWRDEGGSLDIRKLTLDWGPAKLEASATLALDEELQPMGAGTGKVAGFDAALDALAAQAVLTRSAAKAAKAVMSLLADTPSGGQPAEVEVPLTLQFRTLSVRQVPLIRLPELAWPDR